MRFHPDNCSTLYHLEPQGIGTPWVESLSSYINRLAAAHRLTTADLINNIICKDETSNILKVSNIFFYRDASSLNGAGKYASEFTRILQRLTLRNDIIYLSMLPWRKVIDPRGKGLTTKMKRWCPLCFNDQINSGNIVHEHLIWSLAINKTCSVHKIPLQNKCPHCFKKQPPLSRRVPIGYCSLCGHSLSEIKNIDFGSENTCHWSLWNESELGTLVSSSNQGAQKATKERLMWGLSELTAQLCNGKANKLSKGFGFGEETIGQWRRGRYLPRFDYLFFLCFGVGISPTLFLTDPREACKHAHPPPVNLNTAILSAGERRKYDHNSVASKLEIILTQKEIMPQQELATKLNVGVSYLCHRFPGQVKEITKNYQDHKLKQYKKGLETRKKKIREAAFELNNMGIYPSREKVSMVAFGSIDPIRNPRAEEAWKATLDELGYKQRTFPVKA